MYPSENNPAPQAMTGRMDFQKDFFSCAGWSATGTLSVPRSGLVGSDMMIAVVCFLGLQYYWVAETEGCEGRRERE